MIFGAFAKHFRKAAMNFMCACASVRIKQRDPYQEDFFEISDSGFLRTLLGMKSENNNRRRFI
jgi:hypothetical protein